jgi:hypothetical protein
MVLLAYTLYNLGRFFARALRATDTLHTPFSVCVGALNLLSFRLFATMDNPCRCATTDCLPLLQCLFRDTCVWLDTVPLFSRLSWHAS